ncbi:MAG: hypothetical protein ACRDWT_16765 [Jatrophihabitantaceae bacterium]
MPRLSSETLTATRPTPSATERGELVARLGGLVFLALLVVQNVLKLATNPDDSASADQIPHFASAQAWSVHLLVSPR